MDNKTADDWYLEVKPGEPLWQGQIFPEFRILQTTYRFINGEAEVEHRPAAKVVMLTQTCDLARPEKDERGAVAHNVLIAPLEPLTKAHVKSADKYPAFKMIQNHLLPASERFGMQYSLVLFAFVTSVPHDVVSHHAKTNRCFRLKSPYLEHLAQRFGSLFSRIALPEPAYDSGSYKKTIENLRKELSTAERQGKT